MASLWQLIASLIRFSLGFTFLLATFSVCKVQSWNDSIGAFQYSVIRVLVTECRVLGCVPKTAYSPPAWPLPASASLSGGVLKLWTAPGVCIMCVVWSRTWGWETLGLQQVLTMSSRSWSWSRSWSRGRTRRGRPPPPCPSAGGSEQQSVTEAQRSVELEREQGVRAGFKGRGRFHKLSDKG